MPAPPLLDLAVGRTDLEPSHTATSFWAREDALFEDYQLDGPLALAAGRFDLAFVTVWLAPVLLIALGLSMVSADRDTGLLRMQAAASTSLGRRALARAGAALGDRVRSPSPPPRRSVRSWRRPRRNRQPIWSCGSPPPAGTCSSGRRRSCCASSFRLRQEALGAALLALWALVIAVLPAFASATAQAVNPPPSRFSLIAEARERLPEPRSARFSEELKGFLHDHPDLTIGADVAGYVVTNAALTGDIEAAVRPSLARFDEARVRSTRRRPVVRGALAGAAHPSPPGRRRGERRDGPRRTSGRPAWSTTGGCVTRCSPPLCGATDLRPSDYASLPRFVSPGGLPVRGIATAVALLVAVAGLIAVFGARRLSRHDVAL